MRILVLTTLLLSALVAKSFNSNLLIERGVDPQVLNMSVTMFKQDVAYKMVVDKTEDWNGQSKKGTFNIIYSPYASYGIDIRLQIPLDEMNTYDVSDVKNELDKTMGLQTYLQSEKLYDPESFKFVKQEDGVDVISFTYNKKAIPREIKKYKEFKGLVYINNGTLEKIEVTNKEPFSSHGVKVQSYKKTLYFAKPLIQTGYLLKGMSIEIVGTKKEKDFTSTSTGKIAKYWNESMTSVGLDKGVVKNLESDDDTKYKTIFIELDRTFPLLGQAARKEGYDLPKAFGISLINMFQDTTLHMTSFKVGGKSLDDAVGGDSKYQNMTYAGLVRVDMWLLPFLNFGVLLGGTDTSTAVTLHSPNGVPNPIAPIGGDWIVDPGGKKTFPSFKTNSLLYGVGTTLAGGIGNYFATIDIQYLISYTKEADVSLEMLIATPLFGYNFEDYGLRVFGGGQYQDLAETITFELEGSLSGEIGLESKKWAGLIGTDYSFTRHWSGNLMYSYGEDRQNAILGVTYRW